MFQGFGLFWEGLLKVYPQTLRTSRRAWCRRSPYHDFGAVGGSEALVLCQGRGGKSPWAVRLPNLQTLTSRGKTVRPGYALPPYDGLKFGEDGFADEAFAFADQNADFFEALEGIGGLYR